MYGRLVERLEILEVSSFGRGAAYPFRYLDEKERRRGCPKLLNG
jgi:hypothetical protein